MKWWTMLIRIVWGRFGAASPPGPPSPPRAQQRIACLSRLTWICEGASIARARPWMGPSDEAEGVPKRR
eukprot:7593084-Lingulodinium_polyedra.AAC.1